MTSHEADRRGAEEEAQSEIQRIRAICGGRDGADGLELLWSPPARFSQIYVRRNARVCFKNNLFVKIWP